jgi:nicotinamide-nucleotide amidase
MSETPAPDHLDSLAASALRAAEARGLSIVTAESCTGGLLSALLTDIDGLSHVFERGFVVYAEQAKVELLGLSSQKLKQEGLVSRWTARAMAEGALAHSEADVAVAITGYAGPGEGEEGLVHIAVARKRSAFPDIHHLERRYGPRGRADIRARAAQDALLLLSATIQNGVQRPDHQLADG